MARNLKFDLNIDSTALLNVNPTEFYSKSYINAFTADNFRVLPGIKNKTKFATTNFTNLLKESGCDFLAGDQTLNAITIDVCPLSAMAEICRFDIEQSFLVAEMGKGSGASFEVQPFMNFYWDQMAKEIQQEIEVIRWQGDTAGTGAGYTASNSYKAECDGYNKLLLADAGVIDITAAATITPTNVIAEMLKVYQALVTNKPELIERPQDLRWHISADIAAAYRMAVATGNTINYVTENLNFSFLGIKLNVAQGQTPKKMVLTLKDNLIYAFDGEGDQKDLKAVNLEDSVAEPKLRTRADIKIGFKVINGDEIVFYS